MRITKYSSLTAVVLALTCTAFAQMPAPVRTQAGLVQGTAENGLTVYKGIPFAAPPVGDLRWRAPQPPAKWTGVKTTDKFAPACMQVPVVFEALGMGTYPVNEDCLYLNVWTPAKSASERLPVMVWIYGGGFAIGSTSVGTYNGANFAKKGVVLVSLAYRGGPFGFLAQTELSAQNGGYSGNYGLLDQIFGLKWVQNNIAAFGGDPRRVTIFGQSAGGISVSMLAASPLAKGLFQLAISESGGSFAPARLAQEGGESVPPLTIAERNGAAFLSKLSVSSIAEARRIPAETIQKNVPPGLGGGGWPNFDGYVLPGDQYKLYEAGRYNDTPILIGTNSDEGATFVATTTSQAYLARIRAGYGEYSDNILAAYPGGTDAEALRSARDMFRDTAFAWPTWAWARLQSKTGKGKVFVYYFSHRPPYPDTPQLKGGGAAHGDELSYVFGNFSAAMPPSDADKAVADQVSSYWVNFARTGDPNGAGLPKWPVFTNANPQVLNINDPSKAVPVPNVEKLQVLEGYYAWRRSQAEAKH